MKIWPAAFAMMRRPRPQFIGYLTGGGRPAVAAASNRTGADGAAPSIVISSLEGGPRCPSFRPGDDGASPSISRTFALPLSVSILSAKLT